MLISTAWEKVQSPIPLGMLRDMYDQPTRAYHRWFHIEDGIRFMTNSYAFESLDENTQFKVLAAWFMHDVIYDAGSKHNEENSAAFAYGLWRSYEISEGILATKHHHPSTEPWVNLLIDTDLMPLASDNFEFLSQLVMEEYGRVYPLIDVVRGRIAFLEEMLQRKQIFTNRMYGLSEQEARKNIEAEVKRLKEHPCGLK